MLRVRVDLGPRSHDVRIAGADDGGPRAFAAFAREALEATWAGRGCRAALVVTDPNVGPIARDHAEALAAIGIDPSPAEVPAGEGSKSLEWAAGLYDRLIAMKADRHAAVVAVGGGVVGDLAGFVAATYARGLPLVMVPTTLLAQVDSSVGGKVGVNRPGGKNLVGAFHQPAGVWIDPAHLASLPDREYRCGLAEVVKYGVILDPGFFGFLEDAAPAILARDPAAVGRAVARSCELKARVVALDEREETGARAALNFGHTVGHAIEAVAGYDGPFRHGEAVAAGMVAEATLAEQTGRAGAGVADRIRALLDRFGLPTAAPGLDPAALLAAMALDKKNRGGAIRFVLPTAIGRVEPAAAPPGSIAAALVGAWGR